MLNQTKTFLTSNVLRSLSTSTVSNSSRYYDVLGVTPKATHTEIKSAYYKLSMLHHPDKSTDETSAKKFRDLTEAYEVLGNVKLKKMYDKGLLGHGMSPGIAYHPEPEPQDPTLKFYKSRTNRKKGNLTMDGTTPVYDFDAWSRQHYGDVFKRTQLDRENAKRYHKQQANLESRFRYETLIFLSVTMVAMFAILGLSKIDYDQDFATVRKSNGDSKRNS